MLSGVSSSTLQRLRAVLESARMSCPVALDTLMRTGIRSRRLAIGAALAPLDAAGCLAVIDAARQYTGAVPTRDQG